MAYLWVPVRLNAIRRRIRDGFAGVRSYRQGNPAGPDGTPGRPAFDPSTRGPTTLFLATSVSNLCNYRCRHCHIWTQKDPLDGLSTEQRRDVIRQFGKMSPGGTVVLSGGEVTMNMEELLSLAATCKSEKLPCTIITNGSNVADDTIARALVSSGITWVTVSLDSHVRDIHCYTRGLDESYDNALRAMRLLAEARDARGDGFRLSASCVVFDQNLKLLSDYIGFCRRAGVDHCDFQLLSRTFANANSSRDAFFEKHFWHTPGAKREAIVFLEDLIHRNAGDRFLLKKPADLPWMRSYILDPDFRTSTPICGSHEKNMIVDSQGRVALCFNTPDILKEPYIGQVAAEPLSGLWSGAKASRDRAVMSECTLGCGALNCHRR